MARPVRKKRTSAGKRHDEKFKATAVITLESQGYPANPFKLQEVADNLKVSARTLRRWYSGREGAPAPEIVQQEKKALADVFEDIAYTMLAHAGKADVVDEMSGNSAVTSAAIAVDKMQLLRGLPTEIVGLLPALLKALLEAELDPKQVFNDLIAEAARAKQELSAKDAGAE